MTDYDWRDNYPFLKALTEWWNSGDNRLRLYYGKFEWIEQCEVVAAGCAEGTCQWENIILSGRGEDGKDKYATVESADVARFFRSVSQHGEDEAVES